MTALLHSTASNPTSAGITPEIAGISPKAKASDLSDAMSLFMQLTPEGKKAALAVARWLVEDRRPETDPRKLDPYWQSFPDACAVQLA